MMYELPPLSVKKLVNIVSRDSLHYHALLLELTQYSTDMMDISYIFV